MSQVKCDRCDGTGTLYEVCHYCPDSGPCGDCFGDGDYPVFCDKCNGKGVTDAETKDIG